MGSSLWKAAFDSGRALRLVHPRKRQFTQHRAPFQAHCSGQRLAAHHFLQSAMLGPPADVASYDPSAYAASTAQHHLAGAAVASAPDAQPVLSETPKASPRSAMRKPQPPSALGSAPKVNLRPFG